MYQINVTNTCEIVRGKSDAAFRLGQETLQRPFRIYQNLCIKYKAKVA